MLGCTSRGAPIATLMASLPHVVERVKHLGEEVQKTRRFVRKMEEIEGITQVGIRPNEHDLVRFETPVFGEITQKRPRRGFFLYEELKKRNISPLIFYHSARACMAFFWSCSRAV